MREEMVEQVVAGLRERGIIAGVARPAPFTVGVRVPLPDGREVLWDVDGAAGLEAQVMRDGMLVGFVPLIEGSEAYDVDQTVEAIATADYGPAY